MSVQFNEEPLRKTFHIAQPKGITGFIIKIGIAKDVRQANFIMIGIIGIMAVIFIISSGILEGSDVSTDFDPALDGLSNP